jgi:hypothetical protein
VITFTILKFIIYWYSTFNLSWIKNKNSDFGVMITYQRYAYSIIQIDYSYRIAFIYRREIVSIGIRSAGATNREVTESRATVMGPFITSSALEQLCIGSGHWTNFRIFNIKVSSTSSDESNVRTFFFSCLGFREFSWLSLNSLLHLIGFACFSFFSL